MSFRLPKQSWLLALSVCLCAVVVYACDDDEGPADQVYTRAKRGVDFSQYKTFHVDEDLTQEDLADAGVDVEDFPDDIKYNIDAANAQARVELQTLGLTEADNQDDADLIVATMGSTKSHDAIYWECVPGYWWGYYGWYWDSCAWLDPEYVEFAVGSLVLGLADPEMKDIVFGGLLQGVVTGGGDATERIRAGVHEMFLQYPKHDASK
jgi:hypothetical protein